MTRTNWHPSPRELRRWALIHAPVLVAVGALFYFFDWGIFADGQGFAKFLWVFAGVAFVTGSTGTKLGLPAYWTWMGFVWAISSIITFVALTAVYFAVVTPLALIGKLSGRDRLHLCVPGVDSYWSKPARLVDNDPLRQF